VPECGSDRRGVELTRKVAVVTGASQGNRSGDLARAFAAEAAEGGCGRTVDALLELDRGRSTCSYPAGPSSSSQAPSTEPGRAAKVVAKFLAADEWQSAMAIVSGSPLRRDAGERKMEA
jgi:hypothetical protein